jgi:hypothetical protein
VLKTPWRCECCGHYRAGTPEEVLTYYRDESGGPDACWPFTGALSNQGYGAIQRYPDDWRDRHRARQLRAHRLALALHLGHTGPDADQALGNLAVMHLCDDRYPAGDITYRRCCNPAHLALGTLAENHQHMHAVGRHQDYASPRRARGERTGNAVLTDANVVEMRRKYAAGGTAAGLAFTYGVSQAAAWNAIHGVTFAHLPEAQPRRGRGKGSHTDRVYDPTTQPRGEAAPQAVLTEATVAEMRRRYGAGEHAVALAAEFGIGETAAWAAIHGVTWAHLPGAQPKNDGRRGWPKGKPRKPR